MNDGSIQAIHRMTATPLPPGRTRPALQTAFTKPVGYTPPAVADARIARIEDAPDAEESLRVRVAEAMWATSHGLPWSHAEFRAEDDDYLRLADAALAVVTTRVEGAPVGAGDPAAAVARVEALVERAVSDNVGAGISYQVAEAGTKVKATALRAALRGAS